MCIIVNTMVHYCVVCKACNKKAVGSSFHLFPSNKDRKEDWLNALNIEIVSSSSRVCSNHFQESDYSQDTIFGKARLKSTAVPCIDLTKDSEVTNKPLVNVNKSMSNDEHENVEDINLIGQRVKNGHEGERRKGLNFGSNGGEENVRKRSTEMLSDTEHIPLENIRRFSQINIDKVSKSPEESKMCLEIAKEIMQDQAKRIKVFQAKSGRLKNKIRDLKSLVGDLTRQSLSYQGADASVTAQQQLIQSSQIECNFDEVFRPTNYLDKLTEKKEKCRPKEAGADMPCIIEIFDDNTTNSDDDDSDLFPVLDDSETFTENGNRTVIKNKVEEYNEKFNIINEGSLYLFANKNHDNAADNDVSPEFKDCEVITKNENKTKQVDERFTVIEEDSLHQYPIKNHDRVISVAHTDAILAEAIKSNVVVYQYGSQREEMANKRILFFGSVIAKCPECKITLKNGEPIEDHIKTMHRDMKVPKEETSESNFAEMKNENLSTCPVCQINMHTTSLLAWHLRAFHKDYKPHLCEKCGRTFKSNYGLAVHVKKYENFESCDVRKCHICSEMVCTKDYKQHRSTHEKSFVCDECGLAFMTLRHFKSHCEKHQSKEKDLELCPVCGKMAKTLAVHLRTHETGAKKYMCHKCPKFFMTQHHLTGHIKRVHLEYKVVQCSECPKKFSTPSYLRDHYKLKHSDNYRHTCTLCGKGFSRIDYLKRHVNSHSSVGGVGKRRKYRYTGEKLPAPAKCKYCSKQFKTVHRLRMHLLTHLKILRYKCKFCSLSFSDYSNKYRHEQRHKRPGYELSCEICWKRLESKEKLDEHMLNHESSKKYKCEYCGASFARRYLLSHHVSENHISVEEVESVKEALLADALEEFSL